MQRTISETQSGREKVEQIEKVALACVHVYNVYITHAVMCKIDN